MAQDLIYISSSLYLELIKENDPIPYIWTDITRLEISGSGYDAPVSGSEFIGTVGIARIYAYSGSALVVSLPLEETNIYYNNPPLFNSPTLVSTSSFVDLNWNFTITNYPSFNNGQLSGSGASIYDTTISASYIVLNGMEAETSSGIFSIIANNTYSFTVSGSGSTEIGLYINNNTSGSIIFAQSASSGYISASYVPLPFNNYSVTFSVIGSAP
jgi:hypothetical protein